MTNTTTNTKRKPGNPNFTKGNSWGKLGGRPCKHQTIKALEQLREDINMIPDVLLKALAFREQATLQDFKIPLSQVTRQIVITARGLLYERGVK